MNKAWFAVGTVVLISMSVFIARCSETSAEQQHAEIYGELFSIRSEIIKNLDSPYNCRDALDFVSNNQTELSQIGVDISKWVVNSDCESQYNWMLASSVSTVLDDFESIWILTREGDIRSVALDSLPMEFSGYTRTSQ